MYINAHEHLSHYPSMKNAIHPQYITLANTVNDADFCRTLKLRQPNVLIGYGIHPWEVTSHTDLTKTDLYVQQADFIGEVGLDYLWAKNKAAYPYQREVFEHFVILSKKHHKFLNIHTKDAEQDVLSILKFHEATHGIIHWYSGPLNLVDEFLDLGYYFTISVDAGYSTLTDQLIDHLPLSRLLTEIDGPEALEWVNGHLGGPEYIPTLVQYIAKRKRLDSTDVEKALYQNLLNLLNEYQLVNRLKHVE